MGIQNSRQKYRRHVVRLFRYIECTPRHVHTITYIRRMDFGIQASHALRAVPNEEKKRHDSRHLSMTKYHVFMRFHSKRK